MDKELIKEKLKNLRAIQTHIWTAILITAGGPFTLLHSFNELLSKILSISGFIFFLFLLNVYLNRNEVINQLTDKLEDSK